MRSKLFVVDPYRSSELRGNPSHSLPIARHKGDPLADQRDEPLVVEVVRAGVEDVDGPDMARGVRGVQGQQRHLERRQPLRHRNLSCLGNPWSHYGTTGKRPS